ncbi:unnamed protein product [Phytophthora fragariaefolia]|uniref:Unnamed protein product n=1 Tax=Phytophthora fragariaefolia TaxID=1490495 RepID=A0A9W6YLY0_9STRA|nr:unnamed protein product [Phytophthora fragariaefolia]
MEHPEDSRDPDGPQTPNGDVDMHGCGENGPMSETDPSQEPHRHATSPVAPSYGAPDEIAPNSAISATAGDDGEDEAVQLLKVVPPAIQLGQHRLDCSTFDMDNGDKHETEIVVPLTEDRARDILQACFNNKVIPTMLLLRHAVGGSL